MVFFFLDLLNRLEVKTCKVRTCDGITRLPRSYLGHILRQPNFPMLTELENALYGEWKKGRPQKNMATVIRNDLNKRTRIWRKQKVWLRTKKNWKNEIVVLKYMLRSLSYMRELKNSVCL